jgi:hypothetical protein
LIARTKARIEELRQSGNVAAAGISDVSTGVNTFVGSLFGGAKGGQTAAFKTEIDTMMMQMGQQQGASARKQEVLDSLIGVSAEDQQRIISEYNQLVQDAYQSVYVAGKGMGGYVDLLKISPQDAQSLSAQAKQAGAQTGKAFADGMFAEAQLSAPKNDLLLQAMQQHRAVDPNNPLGLNLNTPQGAFGARMSVYANEITPGEHYDPNAISPISQLRTVDTTRYTQSEITNAKKIAVQLAAQEVQLTYQLTLATTGNADAAKKASDELQKQIDQTLTLVKTTSSLKGEWGATGKYMSDALQVIKQQEEEAKSNFHFQRLKDVDPSQAGQLQGLITMYTQMLQKMGSTEPVVKINTLMGENNTYKQFTGSLTALQLALEDLTKVEKAQLAGTWNLPSGATALVPIQSLDIQRWNKSGGGGGIDPAALAGLMGATNQSGDKVSTAMGTAADRITAAIREQYQRAGITPTEGQVQSASLMAQDAIKAALGGLGFGIPDLAAIGASTSQNQTSSWQDEWKKVMNSSFTQYGPPAPNTSQMSAPVMWQQPMGLSQQNSFSISQSPTGGQPMNALTTQMSQIASNIASMTAGLGGGLMGGGGGGGRTVRGRETGEKVSTVKVDNTVNMSALPLKANFNAQLSVMLNGQVVAKAILPILYQMMIKMSNTTPTAGGGVGSLR